MNRFDRINAIVLLLQTRRTVTAEWLAGHFNVSERTIYRDMRSLENAGVMVSGEAGVGYFLPKDYKLPPVMFSEDEAAAVILAAGSAKKMLDETMVASLESAMLKLRAVLPATLNAHLNRLNERLNINLGVKTGEMKWLFEVQRAVAGKLVIKLVYHSAGAETEREVEPVGLLFYSGQWHLVGWCRLRGDFRDFRTDRIQFLEETGEKIHGQGRAGLAEYLSQMQQSRQFERATVLFSADAWTRYSAKTEPNGLISNEQQPDGGVLADFFVWDTDGFCRWLLTFAGGAVPVQPAHIADLFNGLANAFKKQTVSIKSPK